MNVLKLLFFVQFNNLQHKFLLFVLFNKGNHSYLYCSMGHKHWSLQWSCSWGLLVKGKIWPCDFFLTYKNLIMNLNNKPFNFSQSTFQMSSQWVIFKCIVQISLGSCLFYANHCDKCWCNLRTKMSLTWCNWIFCLLRELSITLR